MRNQQLLIWFDDVGGLICFSSIYHLYVLSVALFEVGPNFLLFQQLWES